MQARPRVRGRETGNLMKGVQLKQLKPRLTYANVVATIAVFIALGGGAIAAITIPKKSVGTKQLKAKAVTNPKLADGAVSSAKLADAAVTSAKLAGGVAFKNVVYRQVVDGNKAAGSYTPSSDPSCLPGEVAIDGGVLGTIVGTNTFPNLDVDTRQFESGPETVADGDAVPNGGTPNAWHVSAQVISGPRDLHWYVLCAQK
jgi:hypothetical protein